MEQSEHVVIHVDIDFDAAGDQAKIEAFFKRLEHQARRADRTLGSYQKRIDSIDRSTKNLSSSTSKAEKDIGKFDRALAQFGRTLANIGRGFASFLSMFGKFSFIGTAAEIGLLSVALLSVKLALVTGRLVMKAYQATLTGLGIAAGGVAVALGGVAAAMRQINEAQLAPNFSGGLNHAAQSMRAVMNDEMLGFFGIQGLQGAVGALARGGVSSDAGYTRILRQLGNYTQDPKQLADLAAVYASVNKSGVISSADFGKLSGINSVLGSGISELTGLSGADLESAIAGGNVGADVFSQLLGGKATVTDAWEKQLENINNTVVGTLKASLAHIFQLFADLGQPFLNSIQQTLLKVELMISDAIMRIRGAVTGFGLDSLIPGTLQGLQKITDWMVELINESLPKVTGWVERIGNAWDKTRDFFNDMGTSFAYLEEGANVLMNVLKPQFGAMFGGFGKLLKDFNDMLVENSREFQVFGDAIGNLISSVLDLFGTSNGLLADALPVWSDFLNTLASDVVPAFGDLLKMLHEASLKVLPSVASALKVVASAISSASGAISALLKIPGIGLLLGAMMFKTTRAPLMAAARPLAGMATSGMSGLAARQISLPLLLGSAGAKSGTGAYGLMGASAAVPATMSLGAMLGVAGVSAASSAATGTFLGNRVGGAGGIAAGAGGGLLAGALTGAGTGALLASETGPGAIIGALIGGGVGLVGGAASSWFAHRRQDKANKAADELVSDFYDGIADSLSKGEGRAAIDAARSEMEKMLENVAATAEKLHIDETELRKRLLFEQGRMNKELESRERIMTKRMDFLSEATGMAAEDIERLADVMNVNLTDATGKALDQLLKLGIVSEYDMSLTGLQDFTNKTLQQNLFGSGSVFERKFVAPEQLDTFNALLNEAYDVKRGGGELGGDLVRNIVESVIAYDQTQYGMSGSDLIQGLMIDLPRIDEILGTDGLFASLIPDLKKTYQDILDPKKNPALQGLYAAILDEKKASFANRRDQTPMSEIYEQAREEFDAKLQQLSVGNPNTFEERLAGMISASRESVSAENIAMVNTELQAFYRNLRDINEKMNPPERKERLRKPFGYQRETARGAPDITKTSIYNPTGIAGVTATNNVRNTTSVRSSATVSVNVYGYTDSQLASKIAQVVARETRNASQRGADAIYEVADGKLVT